MEGGVRCWETGTELKSSGKMYSVPGDVFTVQFFKYLDYVVTALYLYTKQPSYVSRFWVLTAVYSHHGCTLDTELHKWREKVTAVHLYQHSGGV